MSEDGNNDVHGIHIHISNLVEAFEKLGYYLCEYGKRVLDINDGNTITIQGTNKQYKVVGIKKHSDIVSAGSIIITFTPIT